MLASGDVSRLITDSHEAHNNRIAAAVNVASTDTINFSKIVMAAILADAGEVGRACKVAFTYGLETDDEVAARFLKELTLQSCHGHIAPHTSYFKPAKNLIP
jgi:hypothetical protein